MKHAKNSKDEMALKRKRSIQKTGAAMQPVRL